MEAREQECTRLSVDPGCALELHQQTGDHELFGGRPCGRADLAGSDVVVAEPDLEPQVVQEVRLNGRHFIDLFPIVAGTVTPPQNGSLSAPTRGTGASGFNSAGYREDMTNLMINGITHTDLQQNQIAFQPTINIVSEFKVIQLGTQCRAQPVQRCNGERGKHLNRHECIPRRSV